VITALLALGGGAALAIFKWWLGRRATPEQQQVADLRAVVKGTVNAQADAERAHGLSDDELNRELRKFGAGR
jgi:hypothetical protein